MSKPKLLRITTVPISMNIILKGQLGYMSNFFEVIGVTGYDHKHFNEIKERENIRMEVVNMHRAISPFDDLRALAALYKLIKKERPYIVHTHTPKAGLLGMLAAKMAGVPVRVHTVGGLPLVGVKGPKRILLNKLERLTYSCAHKIYPNSKGLKDIILENNFCKPDKLKVIGNGGSNGINTDYFKPDFRENAVEERKEQRAQLGIKDNELVFCFVGRIAREKGIIELIEVFEELKKEYPIKLLLIGPFEKEYGALDKKTENFIEADPDILNLGRFDDVRPYYSISDIYVFPSYREGFPNSVLEAGAMGLPAIVTNINGCNEIITNGLNGMYITPKDTLTLKEAMAEFCSNDNLRQQIAANARTVIVDNFRREYVWQELLKEYQELLNNSHEKN